jgi:hypothetical protein
MNTSYCYNFRMVIQAKRELESIVAKLVSQLKNTVPACDGQVGMAEVMKVLVWDLAMSIKSNCIENLGLMIDQHISVVEFSLG